MGEASAAPIVSAVVPDLGSNFDELLRRLGEISDLQRAGALLVWDQETGMPPLGAPARAEQLATVARLAHDRATAPELGSLLEELRELEESSERDSFEASVVRIARRDYEKKRGVPSDLRAKMTRAGSIGYTAWLEARAAADYEIFRPPRTPDRAGAGVRGVLTSRSTTRTTRSSTITSGACEPPRSQRSSPA